MPVSASLWAASAAVRIASLNLCTDEYLLLAARRQQIASVSRLAADRDDSPLWRVASGLHINRGRLEDVIAQRPTVLLTMGGSGRATRQLAQRLGMTVIDLPYPQTIDDVGSNLARVAKLTGRSDAVVRWNRRMRQLRFAPNQPRDAIYLGQGGVSVGTQSLAAQWMALTGLRQQEIPGGRVTAEQLLVRSPAVLLRSVYRRAQFSRGQQWLDQPWVQRSTARFVDTDGRPWTCGGPLMPYEIERLRTVR